MSTLNKIAYSVLMSVKPHVTDDVDLNIDKIKYEINTLRSTFLTNEINKNRDTSFAIQDLGCVELELVDVAECCDFEIGCKVLRTVQEIPKFLQSNSNLVITRVGPLDKYTKPYSLVTLIEAPYTGNGVFNRNFVYAYYRNNRIYIKSNDPTIFALKYINIQGVFEDPKEAARFVDCDDVACYTDDSMYPISGSMENYIIETLTQRYLRTVAQPKDNINDSRDKNSDNA